MIDRYTRPEMGHIFSLENKYAVWQEIEVVVPEHLTDDERKVFEKLRKEDTRDYRAEVNKYFAKF